MKHFLYTVVLIFFAAACKTTTEETPNQTPLIKVASTSLSISKPEMEIAGIQVGKITKEQVDETLRVNGTIDVPPQNMISVSFPMGAFLKQTSLLPGMQLKKGQLIASMEDESLIELQQNFLVAKSKLEFTKQDYERQKFLNESKASSDKVFQQAKVDYDMQRVLVRGLGEKLRLIGINPSLLTENNISRRVNIYSPVNGFVSKVNVNIGRFVQPTEVMFELTDPADVHVALTVFEKDLDKVKVGQKVYLNMVDEPGTKYEATVILVSKDLGENRSGNVHCHFERIPSRLKPGMFVNALIHLNNREAQAVPESAVVRFENKHFVFVQHGAGNFEMTEVQEGARFNNFIELVQPPKQVLDSAIITVNAYAALMKLKNVPEEE